MKKAQDIEEVKVSIPDPRGLQVSQRKVATLQFHPPVNLN